MDKNAFYKYQENRAQSGYKAAILVKRQEDTLYSLLVAGETVPSVFGTQDSFDFDLLNSPVKGKVAGKMVLEPKEVEVLHHRDNVLRFEELKDQVLDFMFIDSQFVGYKFNGTIEYRVNDASTDVLRGTYTITPMSADPIPLLDVRPYVQETLCFANSIPETIKAGTTIDCSVVQGTTTKTPTFTFKKYNSATRSWAATSTSEITTDLSSGKVSASSSAEGLYSITAAMEGYASWTTTVFVEK